MKWHISTIFFFLFFSFLTELRDMCVTALANLQQQAMAKEKESRSGPYLFSLQRDIIPFLEQHWEALTTAARRTTQSWHATVSLLFFLP